MSVSVQATVSVRPQPQQLLESLGEAELRTDEESTAEPWPEDYTVRAWLDQVSTRGVGCSWAEGLLSVQLNIGAAPEDFALAVRLLSAAVDEDGEVSSESGERCRAIDIAKVFDDRWCKETAFHGIQSFARLASMGDRGPLTLVGAIRPFVVGDRLLGELKPDEAGFEERFLNAMREVQWLDATHVFEATAMVMESKTDTQRLSFAAWGPNVRYLFPDVSHFLVIGTKKSEEPIPVPYDAVFELAPKWHLIDERQLLVEYVPGTEWRRLRKQALAHRDNEAFPEASPRKPWWRFW